MKTTFLFLLLVLSGQRLAAQCDSIALAGIFRLQVSQADKSFGKNQPYVVDRSTVPFNPARSEFQPSGIYTEHLCGESATTWDTFDTGSKLGTVETDTSTYMEYSCFISTPFFSSDGTKCRIYMSTHFSEWGGSGRFFYYEKKHGKWKLKNASLVWVS